MYHQNTKLLLTDSGIFHFLSGIFVFWIGIAEEVCFRCAMCPRDITAIYEPTRLFVSKSSY